MQIVCGCLTRNVEIGGKNDFVRMLPRNALKELLNLELLWTNAVNRRNRAVKDVIPTLELPGSFERDDVERFLDHTNCLVAAGIAADRTRIRLGDVETNRAKPDPLFHL